MSDLSYIKGIGPSTISKLNKLNIYSIEDLASYYPYRFEKLKKTNIDDEHAIISVTIISTPTISYFGRNRNAIRFKALYEEENKYIDVVIFNRAFMKTNLTISKIITLIGKYDNEKGKFTASDIKLFDLGNRIVISPIYHLVKGLTNNNLRKYITEAINTCPLVDYIPYELSDKYNFINKKDALNIITNPSDVKSLNLSLERFKYEELFLFTLKVNELINRNSINNIGNSRSINKDKINSFILSLPFELTEDQNKVLNEIFNDLESPRRMNRLVQGDVGSGKTIVAFISMYALAIDKYQSALMAPTEILAHQHYLNMKKLFNNA